MRLDNPQSNPQSSALTTNAKLTAPGDELPMLVRQSKTRFALGVIGSIGGSIAGYPDALGDIHN